MNAERECPPADRPVTVAMVIISNQRSSYATSAASFPRDVARIVSREMRAGRLVAKFARSASSIAPVEPCSAASRD